MGESAAHTIDQTSTWRVGILFLCFGLVSLALDRLFDWLENLFKNRKGLLHTVYCLKNELLMLGAISLILTAVQEPLLRICVPDASYTSPKRSLLASLGGSENHCPGGQGPFWSAATMFDTHILLFLVAVTHIMYTTVTMVVCLWKVRRWEVWENEACSKTSLLRINSRIYRRLGRNVFQHAFHAITGQFTESVTKEVYTNVRMLFINRMGFDYDFNFHQFVVNSMEVQLAQIIKMEWTMFLIAASILALPIPSYVLVWSWGLATLVMALVGTKLASVVVYLAAQAVVKYGDDIITGRIDRDPRKLSGKPTLARVSLAPPVRYQQLAVLQESEFSGPSSPTSPRPTLATEMVPQVTQLSQDPGAASALAGQHTGARGPWGRGKPKAVSSRGLARSSMPALNAGGPLFLPGYLPAAPGAAAGADAASPAPASQQQPEGAAAAAQAGPGPTSQLSKGLSDMASRQASTTSLREMLDLPLSVRKSLEMRLSQGGLSASGRSSQSDVPDLRISLGSRMASRTMSDDALLAEIGRPRRATRLGSRTSSQEAPDPAGSEGGAGAARQLSRGGSRRSAPVVSEEALHERLEEEEEEEEEGSGAAGASGAGAGGAAGGVDAADACSIEQPSSAAAAGRAPGPVGEGVEDGDGQHAVQSCMAAEKGNELLHSMEQWQREQEEQPSSSAHHPLSTAGGAAFTQDDSMQQRAAAPFSSTLDPTGALSSSAFQWQHLSLPHARTEVHELLHEQPQQPLRWQQQRPEQQEQQRTGEDHVVEIEPRRRSWGQHVASMAEAAGRGSRQVVLCGCVPVKRALRSTKKHVMRRSKTFARMQELRKREFLQGLDAKKLFWFEKPEWLLKAYQYVFFENSFSMALIFFALWRHLEGQWLFTQTPMAFLWALLCLDFILMVHNALQVLPIYALIQPVGSHCPDSVIKMAAKMGLKEAEGLARATGRPLPAKPMPPGIRGSLARVSMDMSSKLARLSASFRDPKTYKEPELGRRSVKPSEEQAGITESLLGEMIKTQLKRQSLQPGGAGGMHVDAELCSLASSSKHGSHSGLALLVAHSRAASASGDAQLIPPGALQLGESSPVGSSSSALIGAHMLDSQLEMLVVDSAVQVHSSNGSASSGSISPGGAGDRQQSPVSPGGLMVLDDMGLPGADGLGRRPSHSPSRFSPARRSGSLLLPSPRTTRELLVQVPSRSGTASPELLYAAGEVSPGGVGGGVGGVTTLGGYAPVGGGGPSRRTTGGGGAEAGPGQVVIDLAGEHVAARRGPEA